MKKIIAITSDVFLAAGCSNMSNTEQRTLSGASIGAAAGAVGTAIFHGNPIWGANYLMVLLAFGPRHWVMATPASSRLFRSNIRRWITFQHFKWRAKKPFDWPIALRNMLPLI